MLNTAVGLGWNVDFALCNIGGLQSYMPKGDVTIRDIMSILPLDNTLCLVLLKRGDLINLLNQIAKSGGGPR